jgi:hypothetical protein
MATGVPLLGLVGLFVMAAPVKVPLVINLVLLRKKA